MRLTKIIWNDRKAPLWVKVLLALAVIFVSGILGDFAYDQVRQATSWPWYVPHILYLAILAVLVCLYEFYSISQLKAAESHKTTTDATIALLKSKLDGFEQSQFEQISQICVSLRESLQALEKLQFNPVPESDDTLLGTRRPFFDSPKDGGSYAGPWYGMHSSVSVNIDKARDLSLHQYDLKIDGGRISGTMQDSLNNHQYDVAGGFCGDGIVWLLDDRQSKGNFAVEVYFAPVRPDHLSGLILGYDYRSRSAFVAPIVLRRNNHPSVEEYFDAAEKAKQHVRFDHNPTLIKKQILDRATKR